MAREKSLFLDGARRAAASSGATSSVAAAADEWLTGRVTEILADDDGDPTGWVEVEVPADDPQTVATGPTDGAFMQVGALVRVLRSSSGRITKIESPQVVDESDGAAPVVATGFSAMRVDAALSSATDAFDTAEAIAQRAADAQASAEKALSSATSAMTTAESNRPPVVSVDAPSEPVAGLIWYPTNTLGQITGAKVYVVAEDGTGSWVDRPLVGDSVLVPSSVGTVALQDGSVSAPKIYASEELWAKLAAFGAVTTDMLVAGNATITNEMVVNELSGKTIRGSVLSLLDQSPTPSTATGRWIDAMPMNPWTVDKGGYSSDGHVATATTSGLTVKFTDGATSTGLFPSGAKVAMKGVGPVAAVGPITFKITGTTSYAASGYDFMGTTPIGVGLQVVSNTTTRYTKWSKPTTAGGSFSVSVTIPEGEWLHQSSSNVEVLFGAGAKKGDTITVSNVTVSWPPALTTGLQIWRDAKGVARIDIAANDGNAVTLNSSGVTAYDGAGTTLGTVSWRTFVAPPIAVVTFDTDQSIASSAWTTGAISGTGSNTNLSGGMTKSGHSVVVPVAGIYRVTARAKFNSASGGRRAIGISINNGSPDTNTFSNPTTGTFSIECNTLVTLAAGDAVSCKLFQDTGSVVVSPSRSISVQYATATS